MPFASPASKWQRFHSRFLASASQSALSPCAPTAWPTRPRGIAQRMPRRVNPVTPAIRNASSRRVSFFILKGLIGAWLLLESSIGLSQTRTVRVATVADGPMAREILPAVVLESEVANVTGSDVRIEFPQDKRFVGDWSMSGADAALGRALNDKDVDVVLTLGVLGSQQAAQRIAPVKPVIAAAVADPVLQEFPLKNGASGRRNFTYIADFQGIENNVRAFHQAVGFKHLAALVDGALLSELPHLRTKADELAKQLNVRISIVPVGTELAAMLAALPEDADAVYLTGLRLNETAQRELATTLIARRVPSFSSVGRSDLDAGLLMTTGGSQADATRVARRLALSIQRIAQGENPAEFDVGFVAERRLSINMRTAQAIGFSPRWQDLTDAEQLYADASDLPTLTLLDAMHAALMDNPALAASRARLTSSEDDIRIARSSLLPTLDSSATRSRIDADRASPLTQAENSTTGSLSLQAPLYSERAWANYSITRALHEADKQAERQDMLNTLEDTANAYLNVLRAKSVESVRRVNVENTRKNLETSRVREAVGLAERSDYLRWVAQLARDKQELLSAESTRRQAEVELARVLHRSGTPSFQTVETGLDDPLQLIASARTQSYLDTPLKWAVFTDYAVAAALEHAPEIAQADALIAGRQRAVTASRRAFYVPDLAVVTKGSRTFDRSGAGSASVVGGPNDDSWSVSLQATFPILTGGRRHAELSQSKHELRAAEADRNTAGDAVEARARAALHRAGSSYPSIELSNTAAKAADENLAMVSDAYARGAVTVTELIDAQDTALDAGLGAVDAKYSFLADFVAVLHAMNQFDVLLDSDSREAWLQQVDRWFREHSQQNL